VIDDEDRVRTFGLFQFETQLFVDGVEDGDGAIGVATCGRNDTTPAPWTGDTYGRLCAIPNSTRFVPP
jgi:hypothetical protein